jgi:hypothetical protein
MFPLFRVLQVIKSKKLLNFLTIDRSRHSLERQYQNVFDHDLNL